MFACAPEPCPHLHARAMHGCYRHRLRAVSMTAVVPHGRKTRHGDAVRPTSSAAQPLRPSRSGLNRAACCAAVGSQALSDRSETSIASELYHEQPAQDVAPHALLCSADFHLLFFISFTSIGAGLALLDNFPQLLCSIAPRAADGSAALPRGLDQTLLVIFSVANTLGRIAAGFWPEHALHKWVRPPPPSAAAWGRSPTAAALCRTCMFERVTAPGMRAAACMRLPVHDTYSHRATPSRAAPVWACLERVTVCAGRRATTPECRSTVSRPTPTDAQNPHAAHHSW